METASRFDDRVENYVKYRPQYPTQMLEVFREEMNLKKYSIVADIGSGTGISAKPFLENGNQVVGIEPNKAMRNASDKYLCKFPKFNALDATAEQTTLTSESIDLIIVAQAFHWFDNRNALAEFRRILRPDGHIALIWNERKLFANKFLRAYEQFLIEFGTDYQKVRHDKINEQTLNDFFGTIIDSDTFENSQTLDFEGLLGRILSSSYMPSEENSRFREMQKSLKQLFAEHAEKGKIIILYDTNIFYTKI